MGRRVRAPPLVVHGSARADPAAGRELRRDLGRHPAGDARRRLAGEPRRDGRGASRAAELDHVLAVANGPAVAAGVDAVATVHEVLGLHTDAAVQPVVAVAAVEAGPPPRPLAVGPGVARPPPDGGGAPPAPGGG